MKNTHLAYVQLGLAMLLAGSTLTASKLIGQSLPPFLASAIRFAVALPVLCWLMGRLDMSWPRLNRRDSALLLLQAGCGSVGYTTLLISGLRYSSVTDAAIITGTLPAMTATLAMLLLGSRPSLRLLLAIALATAGTSALQWSPAPHSGEPDHGWLGRGLILAAVACEAGFILLQRKLHQPIPALPLAAGICALGLLLSLPPALWEARQLDSLPLPALLGCVYYGLLPTAVGFWLWYAGSANAPAEKAALATAIMPLSAAGMGMLQGETMALPQILGMLAVLLALRLAAKPPHQ